MNKIFVLVLFLFSNYAHAESIILKNIADIQRAQTLIQSIDETSKKVMACMKEAGGSVEVCGCSNLEMCKFKKEFKKTSILYCAIKSDFPTWAGNTINYYSTKEKLSHSLGMVGLDKMLGQYCK